VLALVVRYFRFFFVIEMQINKKLPKGSLTMGDFYDTLTEMEKSK
jgi:hypothetical protein